MILCSSNSSFRERLPALYGNAFFSPLYSIAKVSSPHAALQANPKSGRALNAEQGCPLTPEQSPDALVRRQARDLLQKGCLRDPQQARRPSGKKLPPKSRGQVCGRPVKVRALRGGGARRWLCRRQATPPPPRVPTDRPQLRAAETPVVAAAPTSCPTPPRRRQRHDPFCIPWPWREGEGSLLHCIPACLLSKPRPNPGR